MYFPLAIINLNTLGHVLRKIRFENGGSVQLESVKLTFKLDPETGKPISVGQYGNTQRRRKILET